MERQREPRFACCEDAVVTVLGERETRSAAQVTNTSVFGMTLEMDRAVSRGALLRIEVHGTVLLAEAAGCRQGKDSYYVRVDVEQASNSLAELARTLEELAGEPQSVRMP